METIKKYFTTIVIVTLIFTLLLQKSCNNNTQSSSTVKTQIDTVWIDRVDTIIKEVKITKTIKASPIEKIKYLPGTTIDTCQKNYSSLVDSFLEKNIYKDTISLNEYGSVEIIDTVYKNTLSKRIRNIKTSIPVVTIEKEVKIENKKQLYFGGNIFLTPELNSLTPGLLYKDSKDRIYQVNIGMDINGNVLYGVGAYWKIKL